MQNTITVIESTNYLHSVLSTAFDSNQHQITHADNAKQGFEQLPATSLVCVDLLLDDVDGMSLIEDIRLAHPKLPIVAYINKENCSSFDLEAQQIRAMAEASGANAVIFTPINLGELIHTINRLLQDHEIPLAG